MMIPETELQLSEMIRSTGAPLHIVGGGTQGIDCAGNKLTTTGLSGITLYDPGALTLVAKAGTPLTEINAVLKAENQRLAFEPMEYAALLNTNGTPTIGGVVAGNISGPRRIQAGACRDSLIGVRFVDGMGDIVKNGGRVMKNVTGYDLVKLMAGSHGTLGVLSEVSFKVLPDVETSACVIIEGINNRDAVGALSLALGSPFEVTGAAKIRHKTMIRIEGFSQSVAYRAGKLRSLLTNYGDVKIEDSHDKVTAIWNEIRDVMPFANRDGAVWRISVKPSDASDLLDRFAEMETILDWGGGLIWVLADKDKDIRQEMTNIKGHATLVRGVGFARFHPAPKPIADLSAGIRAKFDPRGVLNTGLMG